VNSLFVSMMTSLGVTIDVTKRQNKAIGRGTADSVVREVNVDWRRPGQRQHYLDKRT
jgi:hypothetical protein